MTTFEALVLGIVQGVTEFLPISSTAHLRIVPALAGWGDAGAAFTAVLQLGTLAAVVGYFLPDLLRMVRASIAWLADRTSLHALIDVSDGISGDLSHIAGRSGVRIAIETGDLPVHADALDAAARLGRDAGLWALHGGEEFEIAACAPAGSVAPLVAAFESRFGIPLTRIGTVEEGKGIVGREGGNEQSIAPGAWDHFR